MSKRSRKRADPPDGGLPARAGAPARADLVGPGEAPGAQLRQKAVVIGRHVLHEHEGETRLVRQGVQELRTRFESAGRRADPHDARQAGGQL
jgi:hypothetical protein